MADKVLVVDDEKLIVKGIVFSLEQDGMVTDAAYDGEEALDKARSNSYDIILLDVMLPRMDGYEVCKKIREFSDVPIMMLTAKGDDADKIQGLEYGADDYITKPFNILEVKARIKAIMRRSKGNENEGIIKDGDITLNTISRRAKIAGRDYNLTSKEYDVLEFLVKNKGTVYSRDELLLTLWGNGHAGDERTVDVHIRRLREKIEPNPKDPRYIRTRWG
ncbi:MAG: response regulator transcription factor, partial [Lachnospiraceae bacterium]|nr:response regulator transcription factor [Lachnospiraceae bacterium]